MASTGNSLRNASSDLKFIRVHQFVEKSIGPWATQARISQLIAEDFDEMLLDQSVAEAVQVTFGKNATDNSTPQVGRAEFIQLTPSRIGPVPTQRDPSNIIHRGVTEQEMINGVAAVRLYVTVFSEAQVGAGGTSRYKDIHQNRSTKKISIYTGEGDNSPLWVNAGQPLRALKWLEKYKAQDPNAKPVIRSFCIPTAEFLAITASAILEQDSKANPDKTFNVDRHYASDQFGIRGDGIRILRDTAIKGSLITYAEDPAHTRSDFGGDIRTVRELRDRLGVPEAAIPNESVFLDDNGEFKKKKRFAGIADKLMNIYATWMGNDLFATEKWRGVPRLRRCERMREDMESYGIRIDDQYWTQIINGGMVPARIARTINSVTS